MKYANLNDTTYILRLELDEDIHDSIQQFCAKQNINNAAISGIGSIDSPLLGHYSILTKQFTDKQFKGIHEVTSLLGNVALVDGQPFAHIHTTISDIEMQAYAGHLIKGKCSATLEIILTSYPSHHWKNHDDAIGLKVWDFDAH